MGFAVFVRWLENRSTASKELYVLKKEAIFLPRHYRAWLYCEALSATRLNVDYDSVSVMLYGQIPHSYVEWR